MILKNFVINIDSDVPRRNPQYYYWLALDATTWDWDGPPEETL